MMTLTMLNDSVYEEIMEKDEIWYMWSTGNAVLMFDLPIWDS